MVMKILREFNLVTLLRYMGVYTGKKVEWPYKQIYYMNICMGAQYYYPWPHSIIIAQLVEGVLTWDTYINVYERWDNLLLFHCSPKTSGSPSLELALKYWGCS